MRRNPSILVVVAFLVLLVGCGKDPESQTDAELGLNAQQASGRRIFKVYCTKCHNAYSSESRASFSLKGMYKKPYLPSGLIANDQFVGQTILGGRKMMPGFGSVLSQKDVEDLIAYLHTL